MMRWARRLWYLVNRRRLESDLAREMAAHRAMMGDPRRFGNTTRLREQSADVWGWRWLDDAVGDVRYGARQLLRSPGFTATAVLTLTLGIAATTAIFSIVNGLLLRPLPVRDPARLAVLTDAASRQTSWSEPVWEQIRGRPRLFDGSFASSSERLNLARGGQAQFAEGLWVSGEFFDVLGVRAALGRTLTTNDDRRSATPVAVISDAFWRRRFDASPDVLGRTLLLDAVSFTIVGVTPSDFFGTTVGEQFDVAIPIAAEPLLRGIDSALGRPDRNWLRIMARIGPGKTFDGANAALRSAQPQIREAILPKLPGGLERVFLNEPLALIHADRSRSGLRDQYRPALLVLLAVVVLVMLIACVNIANLMLAKAVGRREEMGVRMAIGASAGRLVRMLLAEAALVAALGAALGFALSFWLGGLLVAQLSTAETTVFIDLTPDWRVLLFAAAVSIATTVLFGAAPAWRSARVKPADVIVGQDSGRAVGGRSRVASTLVGVQFALSLVLVVGAGLFIRTFAALASQDFGFVRERVLVINVDAPMTRYKLPQLPNVYERVRDAVGTVPGVQRVALSDITPIGGSSRNGVVDVPGREALQPGDRLIMVNVVDPGWFATYGTRLVAGRDFSRSDRPETRAVAIVNEAFVRRFFDEPHPLGRAVGVGGPSAGTRLEIVGVVEDAVYRSVREPAPPTLYTSTTQRTTGRPRIRVSVLASVDQPALLSQSIAAAIGRVDPELTLEFNPLAEQIGQAMNQERLVALLGGFFGTLALTLASIGVFGVTAYTASRRRPEIGVRVAFGAGRLQVVRLVLAGMVWPIGGGIVTGAVLSLWLAQFVDTLTWGLTPRDPATLAVATLALCATGGLAGWIPAWRASRIDPAAALRR